MLMAALLVILPCYGARLGRTEMSQFLDPEIAEEDAGAMPKQSDMSLLVK